MRARSLALAGAALAALTTGSATAQVSLVPRALGVGGAAVGLVRGQEALFVNPANLALPDAPRWSVGLLQLSSGGTVRGLPLGDLPQLARYRDLSDAERDRLFAGVPAAGLDADLDVRAPLAGLQIGPVALGLAYTSVGDHSLSRDVLELFLYGYQEGRTDYDVGNTSGRRMTYWDAAAAYGARVGPLSLGATAHYLRGGTLLRSRLRRPSFDLLTRDVQVGYTGVAVRGGQGFAADFGAAFQPVPSLTLGASVGNAFARLAWSDALRVRDVTLNRQDIENGDPIDLLERYRKSDRVVTSSDAALLGGVTAESLRQDAVPPTVLRAGLDWKATPGTHLVSAYQSTADTGGFAGAWRRTLSAGVQQNLRLLTGRVGYATAFDEGSMWTAGASLGPIDVGVARVDESLPAGPRAGWIGTFGLSVRTRDVRR